MIKLEIGAMKEYITIRNFGPLKDIEALEIKPFTILIGESASGKSTLMKIIGMMRYLYKMANIRSYLRHSKISKSPFRLRLSSMMERQDMGKMFSKSSVIVYSVAIDGNNSYQVRIEDGKLSMPTIAKEHLSFNKISYVSENRNIIPTWVQKAWKNKGATLGFYFHETNDDFANASNGDKEINLDYVGMRMEISHPKGKPTRYRIISNDNKHNPIELTEASSGIQTSAPLILIVDYFAKEFSFKEAFNRSVMSYLYQMEDLSKFKAVSEPNKLPKVVDIHIEEPELSLFPDAQCRLIDSLIYTAQNAKEDRSVNLMLATHSPYILNYINVVLHQTKANRASLSKQNTAVYRLFEGSVMNLLATNERGFDIVDTFDLTEMMSSIFNEYKELTDD
ncbi:MAG: AAA family ATPase [Candidatus Onthomorpha sp.]